MNKIKFLSVSALNLYLSQPNKFYVTRLADEKLPRDPQSLAAAAGTIFDMNVKRHLIKSNSLTNYGNSSDAECTIKNRFINYPWYQKEKKDKTLDELFEGALEPQNKIDEIFNIGEKLFDVYKRSGIFTKTSFHDIENRNIFELKVKLGGVQYVVPIYTILDCVLRGVNDTTYPMDLKVSGYSSGASPKPKFASAYGECGDSLGSHKDYIEDIDFSLIDEEWAIQGCAYGWSIGCELFKPFPFDIHGVFIGAPKKDGSRSIKVCEYKGIITEEFQKLTALKFISAWNTINTCTGYAGTDVPWCDEPLLCEMLSRTEHFGW